MSLGRSNVVDSGVELLGQVEGFGGMPLFFFFFFVSRYTLCMGWFQLRRRVFSTEEWRACLLLSPILGLDGTVDEIASPRG